MQKIYQPIVIEEVDLLINDLTDMNFFIDHEINDLSFTRELLLDIVTEKYISNQLIDGDQDLSFSEDEFSDILKKIIVGSMLHELKQKGMINSYEDENVEEVFFLTKEGKEYLENMRKND
jgi:hypothetical protein